MNEKQTTPVQPDVSGLNLRRREDALKQQEQKKKTRIYAIIAIVTAILVAALLIWDAGFIQRSAGAYQVNGQSYSAADVNYYYFNEYSNYAPYASFYGLDTSLPLDEQDYDEEQTWHDFFLSNALEALDEVAALTTAAKAEGYTISAEGQAAIDTALDSIASAAESYGVDEATYLTYAYGRYMTKGAYKSALQEQYYARDYASYLQENFEITEVALDEYYAENAATLDTFDYEAYFVTVGLTTEYDEEGNAIDFVPAELDAAQATLEQNAADLEEAMTAGDAEGIASIVASSNASNLSSLSSSSLAYYDFGTWLAEDGRKAGDVTKIANNRTNSAGEEYLYGYYVVRFESRTLDEYYGIDFYNMLIQAESVTAEDGTAEYDWESAKTEADELVAAWVEGGQTAEAFLTMAQENSDGSTTSYTNTAKGVQNTEVNDWLFNEEHEASDYAVIQDNTLHGYRVVYFNGYSDLCYWQTIADNSLRSQAYADWLAAAQEGQTGATTSFMAYVGQG